MVASHRIGAVRISTTLDALNARPADFSGCKITRFRQEKRFPEVFFVGAHGRQETEAS